MKRFIFAASIVSIVFASCGSETTTTDSTETNTSTDSSYISPAPDTTNNSLPPVVVDTARTTSTITLPPASLPVANSKPAVSAPVSAAQPATSGALNPEHGKPGHRCDIAVGAPLNSPAAASTAVTPTVNATPVTASPASTPAPTGLKPKLNPAHGQPYHDCAIEVGKPLKS